MKAKILFELEITVSMSKHITNKEQAVDMLDSRVREFVDGINEIPNTKAKALAVRGDFTPAETRQLGIFSESDMEPTDRVLH